MAGIFDPSPGNFTVSNRELTISKQQKMDVPSDVNRA